MPLTTVDAIGSAGTNNMDLGGGQGGLDKAMLRGCTSACPGGILARTDDILVGGWWIDMKVLVAPTAQLEDELVFNGGRDVMRHARGDATGQPIAQSGL
ncbi:hypothetical protein GUJ93_ZPchr0008g12283 [Zizania palustris]|uniref:Uncharacterized protein n=1 Tax=Zizania palustris TaxID=103762 RepID=A0A8J5RM56_ZIZPA|nr:hypothetical protein GUJ93_ZPchr0008g12283 [Zizania palustris]